jgi:glycosyltransferase involved in cell wall biosynthesis
MPETWAELKTLEGPRVRLNDKVVNVREAYGQFDIVVCPSLEESFGRVVAEAMANGIPVVASDIPALRDLIGDEEAGLIFRPGDVQDASRMVRRLVGDPVLRDRLGHSGRLRAAAFEPFGVAREMARLYRVALDQ